MFSRPALLIDVILTLAVFSVAGFKRSHCPWVGRRHCDFATFARTDFFNILVICFNKNEQPHTHTLSLWDDCHLEVFRVCTFLTTKTVV